MEIAKLYEKIRQIDKIDLNAPAKKEEITEFERKSNIMLPDELKNLLFCFNGGEIFIPGTTIYGVQESGLWSLAVANEKMQIFSIPANYLIFAKLNFGDYIAINLEHPNDVIEWDHELDEKFDSWESLATWLEEVINDFSDYGEGYA